MVCSIFFWAIWLLTLPLTLRIVPDGWEINYVVVYSLAGLAAYFVLPSVFERYLGKIEKEKHQDQKAIEQNKKIFLEEQRLRKKYKYIKLNNKENIINSNIDMSDKILLLKIVHGCSQEETSMLLQENNP